MKEIYSSDLHINFIKALFRRVMPSLYRIYTLGYAEGNMGMELRTVEDIRQKVLRQVDNTFESASRE